MLTILTHQGWEYSIDILHYRIGYNAPDCQDHDAPGFSDPGCDTELDYKVVMITPDNSKGVKSMDDIPDQDDFEAALIDHLTPDDQRV